MEIFSDVVKHIQEILRLNNVECVCILPFLERKKDREREQIEPTFQEIG